MTILQPVKCCIFCFQIITVAPAFNDNSKKKSIQTECESSATNVTVRTPRKPATPKRIRTTESIYDFPDSPSLLQPLGTPDSQESPPPQSESTASTDSPISPLQLDIEYDENTSPTFGYQDSSFPQASQFENDGYKPVSESIAGSEYPLEYPTVTSAFEPVASRKQLQFGGVSQSTDHPHYGSYCSSNQSYLSLLENNSYEGFVRRTSPRKHNKLYATQPQAELLTPVARTSSGEKVRLM